MNKDPNYAKAYCNKMQEYIDKVYLRKLSETEAKKTSSKTWYLPYFGIIYPNKIRIMFDAAAKANGVSLNDHLLPGPDLYNLLITTLLIFRIKRNAFPAVSVGKHNS